MEKVKLSLVAEDRLKWADNNGSSVFDHHDICASSDNLEMRVLVDGQPHPMAAGFDEEGLQAKAFQSRVMHLEVRNLVAIGAGLFFVLVVASTMMGN